MKCVDCPDYKTCRRQNDLRRKRHKCKKANEPFVQTRADHLRSMNDESMADALMLFVKGLLEGSGMPVTFEEGFREELLHQLQQPVKDGENDGD